MNVAARPGTPSPAAEPAARPAERVAPTSPQPATDQPSMHALYLQAGGDTDAYDVDRYVGLLRDHGFAKEGAGLTEIVLRTVTRHRAEGNEATDYGAFGRILVDELGKEGWRIHDITRCVRPKGDPLTIGRPMTPEEEQQLVIDAPAARPRRRR